MACQRLSLVQFDGESTVVLTVAGKDVNDRPLQPFRLSTYLLADSRSPTRTCFLRDPDLTYRFDELRPDAGYHLFVGHLYPPVQSARPERTRSDAVVDECLNDTLFSTLTQARSAIISWKEDYNHHRPYSALGNMPPAEFAMKSTLEKQAA